MATPFPFNASDILSYSAGSQSDDPFGFRVVRPIQGLLSTIAALDPLLPSMIAQHSNLLIQAYPAPINLLDIGPRVDTYLSVSVASRALVMAAATDRTAILSTTPLMAARLFVYHFRKQLALPKQIVLAIGGYPCPRSLEVFYRRLLSESVSQLKILFLYGQAEVDAALMVAMHRDTEGHLIYHPRGGLEIVSAPRGTTAQCVILDGREYELDDTITRVDEGYRVGNPQRWHPEVVAWLEQWTSDDWNRRTGYVSFCKGSSACKNGADDAQATLRCQLREGVSVNSNDEVEFYDFARDNRMDWLEKPRWN